MSKNTKIRLTHTSRLFGLALLMCVIMIASCVYWGGELSRVCGGQEVGSLRDGQPVGVPVLLMRPNSSGIICITYRTAWHMGFPRFQNITYEFSLYQLQAKCALTSSGMMQSCLWYDSYSILTIASPSSVYVTQDTDNITVSYRVTALANATGFYDMLQGAQTARAAHNLSVNVDSLGFDVLCAHRDRRVRRDETSRVRFGQTVSWLGSDFK
jgi:hypothetical protein